MKKESIYQMVWYLDTGNIFKREKNGKFEKSNKTELASFLLTNAHSFKIKSNKISRTFTK